MYSIYDNLPSLDDIRRAHEQGRVIISQTDDYLVAKYSQQTVITGDWDELTMSARGIIYDELTGEVVFLPFRKFFNHGENQLPSSSLPSTGIVEAEILEKLDGCFHYDTPVMTPDGQWEKIGKIVKDKSITHVMGFDHNSGEIRPVKITDRFNNGKKDNWLIVRIKNAWSKKSGGGSSTILRVTSNHEFYTEKGYVKIGDLQAGDRVKVRDEFMNREVRSAAFGSLLGDSSLSWQPSHERAILQGFHKEDHSEYVSLKRQLFGPNTAPSYIRESGFGSKMIPYYSTSTKEFADWREWLYPNGTKEVPKDLRLLNKIAIAFWYMDDGSLAHSDCQNDRINFATNGFSEDGCNRLKAKLEELYPGISVTVFNSKGWNMRVNYSDGIAIRKLWSDVAPYFPICMQYKLPQEFRTNAPSVLQDLSQPYEWKLMSAEIEQISAFDGQNDSKLKNSQTAWDIETETHNFFTREVLVHNSMGAVWLDRNGEVRVSTPGSLQSDQAIWGTNWLQSHPNYSKVRDEYQSGRIRGAVSEILFPGSQVVVQYDYGQVQGIHLTAAQLRRDSGKIQYASHEELKALSEELGFGHCDIYDFDSFAALRDHLREVDDFEGFVLHWPESGFRLKFKADEYIRLHRIISRIHPNRISEAIESNEAQAADSFDGVLAVVRDCIDAFPEEHRPPYDEAYERLADELHEIDSTIPPKVELISNSHSGFVGISYKKMCAQDIKREIASAHQAYAFALLGGKTPRLSKVAMRSWKRIRKEIDWHGAEGEE